MRFSEDIKRIRLKSLLTQEAFAKELGVSFASVNRWETGKVKPGMKAMRTIDDFCKKHNIAFDVGEEISGIKSTE